MPLFDVSWKVTEVINGRGGHGDGVYDGERTDVASGEVQNKEADSESAIREELARVLEEAYPSQGMGPTYDIDRIHTIEISPTD